jgi:uncharacterized membrane protein
VHAFTGTPQWAVIAFWMMVAGVVGGGAAAVPGIIDWLGIPRGTRAFAIGRLHGIGNGVVLMLFGLSLYLRKDAPAAPSMLAMVASLAGASLAVVTGWLGGELIERLGIGVHEGAHMNAPSSLVGPARRVPDPPA